MDCDPVGLHLLIVAAGSGRRMGSERNKLLLPLEGRPLLAWTLEAALASSSIAWIALVGQERDRQDIEAIVRVFYRDGFVVVQDALTQNQLEYLRTGVDREVRNILELDKGRVGNRGSHRYSFGGASLTGHQMHNPEWAMLIDLPTVTPILKALFGSPNYISRGGHNKTSMTSENR